MLTSPLYPFEFLVIELHATAFGALINFDISFIHLRNQIVSVSWAFHSRSPGGVGSRSINQRISHDCIANGIPAVRDGVSILLTTLFCGKSRRFSNKSRSPIAIADNDVFESRTCTRFYFERVRGTGQFVG